MIRHLGLAAALIVANTSGSRAESWCAMPLDVHEWGVHVVGTPDSVATPDLPPWFYTPDREPTSDRSRPVRDLPADSGVRALPVVHFYGKGLFGPGTGIPVGIEVGFKRGAASAWYPAVDTRRPAAQANSQAALLERVAILADRVARQAQPYQRHAPAASDPTRQLVWDRLDLTADPAGQPRASDIGWVAAARALDGALWVRGRSETERFVFYEAATREAPALQVSRGPAYTAERRQFTLTNTSAHAVHDIFVVHRDGARVFVFEAPLIDAGKSIAFVLEPAAPNEFDKFTSDRLRTLLVDPAAPAPKDYAWGSGECVMMRDPSVATESADSAGGHRLFAAEVDLLLATWKARFFGATGTTIIYREDQALLDEVMPLSVYTDMYHFIRLRRASLALWPNVVLP